MAQGTLFQTAKEISLSEETIAINFRGRWEVYTVDETGLEIFSHYANPKESLQLYQTHSHLITG